MSKWKLFQRQTTQAFRSQASRLDGSLRRETNLVADANRAAGKALQKGEDTARRKWRDRSRRGPVNASASRPRPAPAVRLADGYVRRAPVQPVYEAPGYRRKLLLRVVWVLIVVALVLFLINYLFHSRPSIW